MIIQQNHHCCCYDSHAVEQDSIKITNGSTADLESRVEGLLQVGLTDSIAYKPI
jgi:hypothetical protein